MAKRKATALAQSPLIAMAERAVASGAEKAVLVYLDGSGYRICTSLPEMDPLATAGLLSLVIADLAASTAEEEG